MARAPISAPSTSPSEGVFVAQDWADMRDLDYRPSLAVLPGRLYPVAAPRQIWPGFAVRNQRNTPQCVGHALAQLIDLQRRAQQVGDGAALPGGQDVVSADMLYWMAALHDEYPDLLPSTPSGATPDRGVRSLRSAIKAFYHHGVCPDHPDPASRPPPGSWQSACYRPDHASVSHRMPTVAQAKAARTLSPGAYYRLTPWMNDYHAALNDTGAILVSAMIHAGWDRPFGAATRIDGPATDTTGAHAFVIVGYDEAGFLVLNSWGTDWGGYAGLPGVAHWSYRDWAATVIDGWVLRLAVSAPDAFDLSIGRQGLARTMGMIRAASPRGHQLIGHYLHLDDGHLVNRGAYPSDGTTWPRTHAHLKRIIPARTLRKPAAGARKGVLLWLPGTLEGLDPAVAAAIGRKAAIAGLGLYPYSIFWCNAFVEKSLEVLTPLFESCAARVGAPGPELDALIEGQLRGVGRAFWRDIELSARRAVHGITELPDDAACAAAGALGKGPVAQVLRVLLALVAAKGCELHVVCEGAGALVLHEALRLLAPEEPEGISSLSLIHPAIDLQRARHHLLPLIARMNKAPATEPPRARIYLPDRELEQRLGFGLYGGSLLQLVARSFEDRQGPSPRRGRLPGYAVTDPPAPPRVFLGMSAAHAAPEVRELGAPLQAAFHDITTLRAPAFQTGRVPYADLVADPQATEAVFQTIRALRR